MTQGNYSGAETVFRQALRAADEQEGDPVESALTLGNLSTVLGRQVGLGTT